MLATIFIGVLAFMLLDILVDINNNIKNNRK